MASLTLVDITPQMKASGVMWVVGFIAARTLKGFASPEETARVISDHLRHRPTHRASSDHSHCLRKKDGGHYCWHWDPVFIDGTMRRQAERIDSRDLGRSELGEAASRPVLPIHLIRGGSSGDLCRLRLSRISVRPSLMSNTATLPKQPI